MLVPRLKLIAIRPEYNQRVVFGNATSRRLKYLYSGRERRLIKARAKHRSVDVPRCRISQAHMEKGDLI